MMPAPPAFPSLDQRIAVTRRPRRFVVMHQRWEQLLFLHWTVPPETVQATLPPGLFVDTHDGRAYLGVVPFFMRGVRPRFCPPVPGLSNFLELNLRTYVHDGRGRPGVWFYSLDADQPLAVRIARAGFGLPYFHARMDAHRTEDGWVDVRATRPGDVEQRFRYRPERLVGPAVPGSLEFFLVERYLLFSYRERRGILEVGQVHHAPYPLAGVELDRFSERLFALNGFVEPGRPPDHAIMAGGVAVSIYGLQRAAEPRP